MLAPCGDREAKALVKRNGWRQHGVGQQEQGFGAAQPGLGHCMLDERSPKTVATQGGMDSHARQLKPFFGFLEKRAHACDLTAMDKAEDMAAAINDLAWIGGEVAIDLLDREVLGYPDFIEPDKRWQMASVVGVDLHGGVAVDGRTPRLAIHCRKSDCCTLLPEEHQCTDWSGEGDNPGAQPTIPHVRSTEKIEVKGVHEHCSVGPVQ